MNSPHRTMPRTAVLMLVVVLTLLNSIPAYAGQGGPTGRIEAQSVTLPAGADVAVEVAPADKADPDANLQSMLAQVADAWAAGDRERLASFRGERFLDVDKGTATVILEMARDPQVERGANVLEKVTLADGRTVTIDHGPKITVRADLQAALDKVGAKFQTAFGQSVQVSVPFAALRALARLGGVASVRLPYPAKQREMPRRAQPKLGPPAPTADAVISEGVSLTQTNLWQAGPFNYSGAGVNLAVFDFGFTGWAARQSAGDLPVSANLVLKDFDASTGGWDFTANPSGYEHGTACAEIAYDMAPGTKVYLYAFGTDAEFQSAVADYNAVSGKKVASMSVGWVNSGPYDGTGSIDDAVNTSANTYGVFWAVAAGNDAQAHWSGTSTQYSTGNFVKFGTDQFEEFGSTETSFWVIPNTYGTIDVFLEWNDWNAARNGNASHVDYDLTLWRYRNGAWGTSAVASSTGNQCGSSTVPPTEQLSYTLPTNCDASTTANQCLFRLRIARYTSGCTNNFGHWLNLFTWTTFWQSGTGDVQSFAVQNVCNSITAPAEADGAVGVGASFWGEDTNATYNYGLETFSSLGPRSASGGTNPGTTVNKPDVVGPDLVSTAAYGPSNGLPWRNASSTGFAGTSGATPHVAGMAAMMWQIWPSYTLAQLKTEMFKRAAPKGSGGTCGGSAPAGAQPAGPQPAGITPQSNTQNNRYGWGRIDLGQPTPFMVDLASFSVALVDGRPVLAWETVSEQDNAGFNVYRGVSEQGPWVKLNDALIPSAAPGSVDGHTYRWIDTSSTPEPAPNGAYWYLLEDVDLNGTLTQHGPVRVALNAPNGVQVSRFGARIDWLELLRRLLGAR